MTDKVGVGSAGNPHEEAAFQEGLIMSGATDTTPPPLCSHLRGYLLAPPTTGYQPIWRCHQCGHDIRLEDLPGAWAKTLQVLSQRISDLEAYWNQKINLSEDLNDGR